MIEASLDEVIKRKKHDEYSFLCQNDKSAICAFWP